MPELRERILAALDEIKDPCSLAAGTPLGLAEMGLVRDVTIAAGGNVAVDLRLTSPFCHMIGFFKQEAIARVGAIPGVGSVTLNADNGLDWSPADISAVGKAKRAARIERMESV